MFYHVLVQTSETFWFTFVQGEFMLRAEPPPAARTVGAPPVARTVGGPPPPAARQKF